MNEREMRDFIHSIVREELAPILMGIVKSNSAKARASVQRFGSEGEIKNLRSIQPFGFASRAPVGTPGLIIPVDGNTTHLGLVGHFNEGAPTTADGEAVLYGADGQVILMKNGGTIHQGSEAAAEPVVLGNVMKDCVTDIINAFLDASQIGFDGFSFPVILDPGIVTALQTALSKYVTTPSTNIVGQKNFVERGS